MASIFKWLVRIFLFLVFLALVGLTLAYYFASRSLPDYNKNHTVSGISSAVEIVRDRHNVPHIFAQNDQDVYFGLGYAHAQDRLWQMLMMRRTAQGRLSEILGEQTLEIDMFLRRLDLYNLARSSFQYQSEEAKTALLSYSAGVNAWLKIVQTEALGRGAPELFLFSPKIAPWTPADSLSITKVMALQNTNQLQDEVLRAKASLRLSSDRLMDLMSDNTSASVMALPNYASLFPNLSELIKSNFTVAENRHILHPIKKLGFTGASNAWVANSHRTARKAPLFAADPHLQLSAPSIWMLARLEFSDGGVIGASIPGLPLIVLGRSNDLAWGLTSSKIDDLDIYIEKLNPNNSAEYLTPNGYIPFKTKDVIINVKGQIGKIITLNWTRNGPVLSPDSFDLAKITPIGHVTSINWTALDAKDTSFSAGLKLMRSKSIKQARQAVQNFIAPANNLILADKNGIAMQLIGVLPQRDITHVSKGRIPSQGWLDRNIWKEHFDYSFNPMIFNPPSGIIANTNNKITDSPFPHHLAFSGMDTQRIKRITKLLNARKIHTRDSFIDAQLDTISPTARMLLPLVAKELWFTGRPVKKGTPESQRQFVLERLANWNGEMDKYAPEPLIYTSWLRNIQKRIITDELGTLALEYTQMRPDFIERVFRNVNGASVWCDIHTSTKVETCNEISSDALDQTLLELSEKYGSRIETWRWGEAHQANHDHPILGKIPILSWLVNIRQDTSGGDNTLQRGLSSGEGETPFSNVHASGYRSIVDFADLESSLYIISTGESGHFLSPYYDDLAQLWRRGEYIPMALDPEIARGGANGISMLTPITD